MATLAAPEVSLSHHHHLLLRFAIVPQQRSVTERL
jgi:hypothetical protein